jgi:Asparagine synthase (glutamine-hydrolyzing)
MPSVNGEFYDFERIRTELERKGHRFKTRSDSEILLHLYEEMGTACVEQLRGEFAFALYDAKMDILLVGRDRFGIKPLVFARINGVLVVASEAKALFAAGLQARWDTESSSMPRS